MFVATLSVIGIIYNTAGGYTEAHRYNYLALALAVPLLFGVGSVAAGEMQPGVESSKKRKIRHSDVWLPQVAMTIIQAARNGVRLMLTLAGFRRVLKHFSIFRDEHQSSFNNYFFGRFVSYEPDSTDSTVIILSVLVPIVLLINQIVLRSDAFAALFRLRDDAKVDWAQFWISQLLALFNDVQAFIALFWYDLLN